MTSLAEIHDQAVMDYKSKPLRCEAWAYNGYHMAMPPRKCGGELLPEEHRTGKTVLKCVRCQRKFIFTPNIFRS